MPSESEDTISLKNDNTALKNRLTTLENNYTVDRRTVIVIASVFGVAGAFGLFSLNAATNAISALQTKIVDTQNSFLALQAKISDQDKTMDKVYERYEDHLKVKSAALSQEIIGTADTKLKQFTSFSLDFDVKLTDSLKILSRDTQANIDIAVAKEHIECKIYSPGASGNMANPSETASIPEKDMNAGFVVTGGGCQITPSNTHRFVASKISDDEKGWICIANRFPGAAEDGFVQAYVRYCRIAQRN